MSLSRPEGVLCQYQDQKECCVSVKNMVCLAQDNKTKLCWYLYEEGNSATISSVKIEEPCSVPGDVKNRAQYLVV